MTSNNLILNVGSPVWIICKSKAYLSFFIFSSWILLWFSAASVLDLIFVIVSVVSFFIYSKKPTLDWVSLNSRTNRVDDLYVLLTSGFSYPHITQRLHLWSFDLLVFVKLVHYPILFEIIYYHAFNKWDKLLRLVYISTHFIIIS